MSRDRWGTFMALAFAAACASACVEAKPFEGPEADASGDVTVCVPDCEGRVCGDDGCGDVCGACPTDAPFCVTGTCTADCVASCDGLECGDDGCGGDCGTCPAAAPYCTDGICETTCAPQCDGKECGDDGCDGVCGQCPDAAPVCSANFKCIPEDCTPKCDGRVCGPDGCGGTCGTCEDDDLACNGAPICDESTGQCEPKGLPDCDDENPCTVDSCVESAEGSGHNCESTPDDALTCDDGDLCTTDDACTGGVCSGEAMDCDQGDLCVVGSTCEPETGACVGGEPKACSLGQACDTDNGMCAYSGQTECYDEEGEVTSNVLEQVLCVTYTDEDTAAAVVLVGGDEGDTPLTDGGDASTMQAGLNTTYDPETGQELSQVWAFSMMSFEYAWGINAAKSAQHPIYGKLILTESPNSPSFTEEQLALFKVVLLKQVVDEESEQAVSAVFAGSTPKFVSEGPPVVTPGSDGEPGTWTFTVRLEPDQVNKTMFKSLVVGMLDDQDAMNELAPTLPGYAEFQTKEGDQGPILVLDYSECAPSCLDRVCGSDGCTDGACGACGEGALCVQQKSTSVCCLDSPCAADATCGTSSCGLSCTSEEPDGGSCKENTVDPTGLQFTCDFTGCDVLAGLDIEYGVISDYWVDGEPLIGLKNTADMTPFEERVALLHFPQLDEAVEVSGADAKDQEVYLKVWFAENVDPTQIDFMGGIPSSTWTVDGSAQPSVLSDLVGTDNSDYLKTFNVDEPGDDGSWLLSLEMNADLDDPLFQQLISNGLVIKAGGNDNGSQLLRTSESGFGPVITWKSPFCEETCEGKQCGPNGCGGTCGTCDGGAVCDTLGDGTGSYQCLEPICAVEGTSCIGGNAVSCNALGTGWYESDLCVQDQLACVQVEQEAFCGQNEGAPLSGVGLQIATEFGENAYLGALVPVLHGTSANVQNDPMTLSLWVRLPKEELMINGTIASYEAVGASWVVPPDNENEACPLGDYGWALYLEDGRLKFKTTDSINQTARVSMTEPIVGAYANQWVHLAVVSHGVEGAAAHAQGNIQLYINGVDRWGSDELILGDKSTSGLYLGMSPSVKGNEEVFTVGRHRCEVPESNNPYGQLQIAVDEIATFGSPLSYPQVAQLFGGGCGGSPYTLVDKAALYTWWRMGEGYNTASALEEAIAEGQAQFANFIEEPSGSLKGDSNLHLASAGGVVSYGIDFECAAPAYCEDFEASNGQEILHGCGPGCESCEEGECTSMGWCEDPSCSEPTGAIEPGDGCSDYCGSAPSPCGGQQTYCGFGCGVGSCHHDTANAVASYGDTGFVVVGTSCDSGKSGCSVALWRYTNDGLLFDYAVFKDLASEAFGFTTESDLEEEGLGVDVALDGSYRIVITGRTRTQYNAVEDDGSWRPMVASINGQDLTVEWVYVDKEHYGGFTDVSLVPSGFTLDAGQEVLPWNGMIAVGYLSNHWWSPIGGPVWKNGRLRTSLAVVEGVPLPQGSSWSWPTMPPDPNAPDIPSGGSYRGIDRAPNGDHYTVYNEESDDYAGLDANMEVLLSTTVSESCLDCFWSNLTPLTSPVTSHAFVAVSAAGGAAWPDQKQRLFIAVESEANDGSSPPTTRVLRFRNELDAGTMEFEEEQAIEAPMGGAASITSLRALGSAGFFVAGSMDTPSGVRRPWVERRHSNGLPPELQSPMWRQYLGYESLDGVSHDVPGATGDVIHDCVVSTGQGISALVTVGEILQPNALAPDAPRDAYIAPRTLETGKSLCR